MHCMLLLAVSEQICHLLIFFATGVFVCACALMCAQYSWQRAYGGHDRKLAVFGLDSIGTVRKREAVLAHKSRNESKYEQQNHNKSVRTTANSTTNGYFSNRG